MEATEATATATESPAAKTASAESVGSTRTHCSDGPRGSPPVDGVPFVHRRGAVMFLSSQEALFECCYAIYAVNVAVVTRTLDPT